MQRKGCNYSHCCKQYGQVSVPYVVYVLGRLTQQIFQTDGGSHPSLLYENEQTIQKVGVSSGPWKDAPMKRRWILGYLTQWTTFHSFLPVLRILLPSTTSPLFLLLPLLPPRSFSSSPYFLPTLLILLLNSFKLVISCVVNELTWWNQLSNYWWLKS